MRDPTPGTPLRVLDLGCGKDKFPGAVGVDSNHRSDADVIADLTHFPYPFLDNTFDRVICKSIIEHLPDTPRVLAELHRLSHDGALIQVVTPHFSGRDAYTDPTHLHFYGICSFDKFCQGTNTFPEYYSEPLFIKEKAAFGTGGHRHPLKRLLLALLNYSPKTQEIYERHLTYLFPVESMYFELRVIKKNRGWTTPGLFWQKKRGASESSACSFSGWRRIGGFAW